MFQPLTRVCLMKTTDSCSKTDELIREAFGLSEYIKKKILAIPHFRDVFVFMMYDHINNDARFSSPLLNIDSNEALILAKEYIDGTEEQAKIAFSKLVDDKCTLYFFISFYKEFEREVSFLSGNKLSVVMALHNLGISQEKSISLFEHSTRDDRAQALKEIASPELIDEINHKVRTYRQKISQIGVDFSLLTQLSDDVSIRYDQFLKLRKTVIALNAEFANKIAKKHLQGKKAIDTIEFDDVTQEAILGLFEAFGLYNPWQEKGASFSTYAFPRIKNSVNRYVEKARSSVKIPADKFACFQFVSFDNQDDASFIPAEQRILYNLGD